MQLQNKLMNPKLKSYVPFSRPQGQSIYTIKFDFSFLLMISMSSHQLK